MGSFVYIGRCARTPACSQKRTHVAGSSVSWRHSWPPHPALPGQRRRRSWSWCVWLFTFIKISLSGLRQSIVDLFRKSGWRQPIVLLSTSGWRQPIVLFSTSGWRQPIVLFSTSGWRQPIVLLSTSGWRQPIVLFSTSGWRQPIVLFVCSSGWALAGSLRWRRRMCWCGCRSSGGTDGTCWPPAWAD